MKIAPNLIGWEAYKKDVAYTYEYLKATSAEKLENYDESSHESFADVFIREMKKTTDPSSSLHGERGRKYMAVLVTWDKC